MKKNIYVRPRANVMAIRIDKLMEQGHSGTHWTPGDGGTPKEVIDGNPTGEIDGKHHDLWDDDEDDMTFNDKF